MGENYALRRAEGGSQLIKGKINRKYFWYLPLIELKYDFE